MNILAYVFRFFEKVLPFMATVVVVVVVGGVGLYGSYVYGYRQGYSIGGSDMLELVEGELAKASVATYNPEEAQPTEPPVQAEEPRPTRTTPAWTGPELWDVVNAKRVSYGVNPLANQSELCTIASIRLNELLELGKLDGHEGFSSLPERREDLRWIYEKYNLSEFLVSGADTADEAASLWENTLGHKKLLTGGEYVWGCIYGQNGFGVAITGY